MLFCILIVTKKLSEVNFLTYLQGRANFSLNICSYPLAMTFLHLKPQGDLRSEWHTYLIFPVLAFLTWDLLTFSCMWDSHVYICIKFGHFLILSHVNLNIRPGKRTWRGEFLPLPHWRGWGVTLSRGLQWGALGT